MNNAIELIVFVTKKDYTAAYRAPNGAAVVAWTRSSTKRIVRSCTLGGSASMMKRLQCAMSATPTLGRQSIAPVRAAHCTTSDHRGP